MMNNDQVTETLLVTIQTKLISMNFVEIFLRQNLKRNVGLLVNLQLYVIILFNDEGN